MTTGEHPDVLPLSLRMLDCSRVGLVEYGLCGGVAVLRDNHGFDGHRRFDGLRLTEERGLKNDRNQRSDKQGVIVGGGVGFWLVALAHGCGRTGNPIRSLLCPIGVDIGLAFSGCTIDYV